MKKIKYSNSSLGFSDYLKSEANKYFSERGISEKGNLRSYSKSIILCLSWIMIYVAIVNSSPPVSFFLSLLLGFNSALLGFNVMHSGAHKSFSKKRWLNKLTAFSADLLGWSSYYWNKVHNIGHHTYPNLDGLDNDVNNDPALSQHPSQKWYWFHKFQHVYVFFIYPISSLIILVNDIRRYILDTVKNYKHMKSSEHFAYVLGKSLYFGILILIPSMFIGWQFALMNFVFMHLAIGTTLNAVFPLAYLVAEAAFPRVDGEKIENSFAIHQVETTCDFATDNSVVTWLLGGLNFQVEHHLFPHVNEVHYPALQKIVVEACRKFGIAYRKYEGWFDALISHVKYLKEMGNPI